MPKTPKTLLTFLLSLCLLLPSAANASPLYALSFSDMEGNPAALEQYRGKAVLLNFWATWCPPCIKEMPSMQRLKSRMTGEPFEIVAVNAGESVEAIEIFMMELDEPLNFPVLLDPKGSSFRELNIRGLPMSYLFDRNGTLVKAIAGGREWDSPENVELVQRALKAD